MNNVFLGKPPAATEAWIRSHFRSGKTLLTLTNGNNVLFDVVGTYYDGCTPYNKWQIKSIVFGTHVTDIDQNACGGESVPLQSIVVPSSVSSIGDMAFANCQLLSSAQIEGHTAVGSRAFQNCYALQPLDFSRVADIGSYAFSNCTGFTSIDINGSTASIGEGAFYNCTSLKYAAIGDSVVNIGDVAFSCSDSTMPLSSVSLGSSVQDIGTGVFQSTSLQSIELPASLQSIGDYAFNDCNVLTGIICHNGCLIEHQGLSFLSPFSVGEGAFTDASVSHILIKKTTSLFDVKTAEMVHANLVDGGVDINAECVDEEGNVIGFPDGYSSGSNGNGGEVVIAP